MPICKHCKKDFATPRDLNFHIGISHSDDSNRRKKNCAKSFSGKVPDNLFDVSSRTASKILKRMNVGCSICGWNEASCDVHHIVPKKNGGSNDHDNLTILCPNCHRKAHENLVTDFITITEQVGETWREFYFSHL